MLRTPTGPFPSSRPCDPTCSRRSGPPPLPTSEEPAAGRRMSVSRDTGTLQRQALQANADRTIGPKVKERLRRLRHPPQLPGGTQDSRGVQNGKTGECHIVSHQISESRFSESGLCGTEFYYLCCHLRFRILLKTVFLFVAL